MGLIIIIKKIENNNYKISDKNTSYILSEFEVEKILYNLTINYKCKYINNQIPIIYKFNKSLNIKEEFQSYEICKKCESSESIYKYMMGEKIYILYLPINFSDYECNRKLLIDNIEWRFRIKEINEYSISWKYLVENWTLIEELYNQDINLCKELFKYIYNHTEGKLNKVEKLDDILPYNIDELNNFLKIIENKVELLDCFFEFSK